MAEPILILCHGRSGSHFLGRALAATPDIRWDGERLGWWKLGSDPKQTVQHWIVEVNQWTHHRFVMAKAIYWPKEASNWMADLPCRVMALRRKNQKNAAVSAARAQKSKDWFFGWKPQVEPTDEEIASELERIKHTLLESTDLTVWSEDLWQNPESELQRISQWIGVKAIPRVRVWTSSQRQGVI